MPAPSIARVPAMRTDLRNGDFVFDETGNVIETQQARYPGFTLVFGRRQVGTHHFHRLLARFLNELTFRHIARNHCRGGLN